VIPSFLWPALKCTTTTFSRRRSRFILATNQLDKTRWPAQKCLREYKGQQTVERGFRFLKDPLFFASSVFVKKPQRVEALALIMALTLMVYTLAERKLRQALEAQNQTVLDQRKQPTAKPTFRWIMQKFQGIHWVYLNGQRQISNLTNERRFISHLLGLANTLFTRTQRPEILSRLRRHIRPQFHHNAPRRLTTNGDIEKYFGIGLFSHDRFSKAGHISRIATLNGNRLSLLPLSHNLAERCIAPPY
jgi:hypothetical protein